MSRIIFKDKGFELAIKKFLNIGSGAVLATDLLRIDGIKISDGPSSCIPIPWGSDSAAFAMQIPNFNFDVNSSDGGWEQDLKYFSHISTLAIYVSNKELVALEGFEKLKELYVTHSETRDWRFLSTLINLTSLYLRKCKIDNLFPIEQLYELQMKQFTQNNEGAPAGLKLFNGLKKLALSHCAIKDLTPLEACAYIYDLDLSHNEIVDIKPLSGMRRLYYLTLSHNCIEDISPLIDIPMVYLINLRHNRIKDIATLKAHRSRNLTRLFLADNFIVDFTPIRGMHLGRHDIEEAISDAENLLNKKEGKDFLISVSESKEIVGKWSTDILSYNHENEIIVFEDNGRGCFICTDFDYSYSVVESFHWFINNGKLTIQGVYHFVFEENGRLVKRDKSKLCISETDVITNCRWAMNGKKVKAIQFEFSTENSESYHFREAFGLLNRDSDDVKFTENLYERIWKD